jgi:putative transposase
MILAHKIQIDPTRKQAKYFAQACGTSRFVWNWALAEWNRQYAAGEKPSGMKLKKQFNAVKYQQFPWLERIHRDAHSRPFTNLQSAFTSFFKKCTKHPKFKKRGVHDSFYASNDKLRILNRKIRLPVIGWVRLTESLRFDGKIQAATVSRSADRWFVSLQVDVGDYQKSRSTDEVVGVDLGIKNTITLSTGEVFDSPKALKNHLKRLRRLSRVHSRRHRGSENRKKSSHRLAKLHWRIKCQRHDWLHKLTSKLVSRAKILVIEDLSVKNMMANHKLARAISDEGWYEFRRQLGYKAMIYGAEVVVSPKFYPSSKTCSNCGHVKASLSLSERTYTCSECGFSLDRDLNSARNLSRLGLSRSYACGDHVSPAYTEAAIVEAGTKPCTHVRTN